MPEFPQDIPALISADEIIYEEELALVTARGNVEISHGNRVLLADSISYNQRSKVVTASGNISLMEPTGEVLFADYVELTDDLREGFIRGLRILMQDNARIAAASGTRTGGNRTVINKAVFSPCDLCEEDPNRAPLWQIRADRVIHDQEDRTVRYRDARIEFFGVPLFYTPYFEHPDPTVERKSGFLSPSFGSSDFLGINVTTPYYFNIAPEQDLTVSPTFTTDQGIVLGGQYRHLFTNGRMQVDGAATIADRITDSGSTKENDFRGYVDASGQFELSDIWRTGFKANRASDDTFLRSYDISSESRLTSNAYLEAFHGRNYFQVNSALYQTLRAEEEDNRQPIVLPMVDWNYMSEPGKAGGYYTMDANLYALTRDEGRDSRKASLITGWNLPHTGAIGDVYTFRASLQTDVYFTDDIDDDTDEVDPESSLDEDEFSGRFFPQVSLNWRYPWVAQQDNGLQHIIEPTAQIVLAPNGSNDGEIPNEDSRDVELDDTNLFRLNRFPGSDRVDSGQRVDYGLKYSLSTLGGAYSEAFVGQSYRTRDDDTFSEASGLKDNFSDIVGRVYARPIPELDLVYRFRLDKDDLSHDRAEIQGRAGVPEFTGYINYFFLDGEVDPDNLDGDTFDAREELTLGFASKVSDFWAVRGAWKRDLQDDFTLEYNLGLTYADECFIFDALYERREFRDRELEPEDIFLIRITLKYLGEFGN